MDYIKDDFKPGAPVSQVPASWFNQVAGFLNNLVGGYGIKFNKKGVIPVISLDPVVLPPKEAKKTPETDSYYWFETPSSDQDFMPNAHKDYVLRNTTWTRGSKKGQGVKVMLPTDSYADGVGRFIAWRWFEFDCEGRLKSIGPQMLATESSVE